MRTHDQAENSIAPMMKRLAVKAAVIIAIAISGTAPAMANKTVVMTATNVNAALAALAPGDTLQMEGLFANRVSFANRDFAGVRVDASRATLPEGMALNNVQNIAFHGGTWGRTDAETRDWFAIRITNSSHVSLEGANVVGTHNSQGSGVLSTNSQNVTIRDSVFTGHVTGIAANSNRDVLFTGNQFRNGGSDGIQIYNSQRAILSENRCTEVVKIPGAHADCIQLWSTTGQPLQSDIYLLNNVAIGDMQGFASFQPTSASGTRITFAGNFAAVTMGHGIACYGCTDSRFVDNVITSLPTSPWPAGINTPGGSGNIFTNNAIFDLRGQPNTPLPEQMWSFLMPSVADLVGSLHTSRSHNSRVNTAANRSSTGDPVPEPATWLLMGLGFSLVGRSLRRQSGPAHVTA